MREIFSAFGSEVFRPLMTIFLPGLVAISTAIWTLLDRVPQARNLVTTRQVESAIVVCLLALAAGEILEDIGSRIECWFDKHIERNNPNFLVEWYDYLAQQFVREPVGHRYLRTLVLRLKFQFGLGLALFFCAAGLQATVLPLFPRVLIGLVLAAVGGWQLWEASETHETLGEVRHELLVRWRQQTPVAAGDGTPVTNADVRAAASSR